MACVTKEKLNLYNSEQWIVKKWTKEQVTLYSATKEDVIIKLPTDELADLTRPAYAITAFKSQGATIRKPYTVYDWNKMNERMKYVAISRGTTIKHVNIIEKRTDEAVESDGEQHDVTTVLNRKAAVIEKSKSTLKQRTETEIRKVYDKACELPDSKKQKALKSLKAEIIQVRDSTTAGNATYCSNIYNTICKSLRE
jgi:histidinol phosphatase-like enzyme